MPIFLTQTVPIPVRPAPPPSITAIETPFSNAPKPDLDNFINLLNLLPYVLAIIVVAVIIYCGIKMIISRGDEKESKQATKGIFQAILGLIVLSLFILLAVQYLKTGKIPL